MLKWFLLISGVLALSLAPVALNYQWIFTSVILAIYGTVALRRFGMEKEIKVKQQGITADSNKGVCFKSIPSEGMDLPPINIAQEDIRAKENVGLEFAYNPNSGTVKMSHTVVQGDGMKVLINPEAGSVTINPSVGSVKFISQTKK